MYILLAVVEDKEVYLEEITINNQFDYRPVFKATDFWKDAKGFNSTDSAFIAAQEWSNSLNKPVKVFDFQLIITKEPNPKYKFVELNSFQKEAVRELRGKLSMRYGRFWNDIIESFSVTRKEDSNFRHYEFDSWIYIDKDGNPILE